MKLSFRQGIVKYQTDQNNNQSFLAANNQNVDLVVINTPTVIAFAQGPANYLYTETASVPNAWVGPFVSGTDYWLYWDLNPVTGIRTFGYTTLAPIVATTAPTSVAIGQMWFDTTHNIMNTMSTYGWVPCIRVFAAKYSKATTFVSMTTPPLFSGTQVGNFNVSYAGSLVFDPAGKPIKLSTGTFFTTETGVAVAGSLSAVKFQALLNEAVAQAPMPAYSVVFYSQFGQISLANENTANNYPYGLIDIDVYLVLFAM